MHCLHIGGLVCVQQKYHCPDGMIQNVLTLTWLKLALVTYSWIPSFNDYWQHWINYIYILHYTAKQVYTTAKQIYKFITKIHTDKFTQIHPTHRTQLRAIRKFANKLKCNVIINGFRQTCINAPGAFFGTQIAHMHSRLEIGNYQYMGLSQKIDPITIWKIGNFFFTQNTLL